MAMYIFLGLNGHQLIATESEVVTLMLDVAVGALGVLGWLFLSLPLTARLQRTALAMVLGGALGNIIDRIRLDYVIDFFDVGVSEAWRWPVFNVADSFVTVGVLVLALSWSRHQDAEAGAVENSD